MEANYSNEFSRRSLHWRAERAFYLAEHRPRPLSPAPSDDQYVRDYRELLIALRDAGDDETASYAVSQRQPHMLNAHMFRVHPDKEWEAFLQASLLSGETKKEIAKQLGTQIKVIEYYERLFFDVQGRLDDAEGIREVILGSPALLSGRDGGMTDEQRSFLLRLFAFFGGPDVLDLAIPMIAMIAGCPDAAGLDRVAACLIQALTSATAGNCRFDKNKFVYLLDLAVKAQHESRVSNTSRRPRRNDFELFVVRLLTYLSRLPDSAADGRTLAVVAVAANSTNVEAGR
jgi:hypothetical protein